MRRHSALTPLLVLMIIVAVAPVLADRAGASDETRAPASPEVPPVDSKEAPVALYRPTGLDSYRSPSDLLVADVDQAREIFESRLAALTQLYDAAAELQKRREIQMQIRALKLGIEVEILEIQLRHALHAGMNDVAEELASRISRARERNANALETKRPPSRIPTEPETTPSTDASAH